MLREPNLIFLHIPKNGGSTFNKLLERWFENEETFFVQILDHRTSNIDQLKNLSEEEIDKIRLLKGHVRYDDKKYLKGKSEYITFLRHPIQRIASYYYFVDSLPQHRLYDDVHEKNLSLKEFVLKINDSDVNNAQCRYISGIDDSPEKMLEIAKRNIEESFRFVGLVEKFDESLLLLGHKMGWRNLLYVKRNVTNHSKRNDDINEETIRTILEFNAADMELYRFAQQRLEDELMKIGNSRMRRGLRLFKFANWTYGIAYKELTRFRKAIKRKVSEEH
jgi:hypothetical protein